MTRVLAAGFAVVSLCTVVSGAQARNQSSSEQTRTQTQTVSGCLKTAATPGTFELANATEAKPGGGPTGTSGGAAASKKVYAIVGIIPPGVNLSQHVNHKVELAGVPVDPALAGNTPKFNMHTFKMVAATCQ